jgi:broad specificity phosphatase PhoE
MHGTCTLILVRHAHTLENGGSPNPKLCGRYEAQLSGLGEEQVSRLRSALAEADADAAYASPLKRAMATAAALPVELAPVPLASLQEIDCGAVDGWPVAEILERLPELWRRNLAQDDDRFGWPGGETYEHFRARVIRAARAIAARHCGERVVAVTHAGFVSQLVGCISGARPSQWERFRPGNASITEVRWSDDEAPAVVRYDDRSHLAGLPEL